MSVHGDGPLDGGRCGPNPSDEWRATGVTPRVIGCPLWPVCFTAWLGSGRYPLLRRRQRSHRPRTRLTPNSLCAHLCRWLVVIRRCCEWAMQRCTPNSFSTTVCPSRAHKIRVAQSSSPNLCLAIPLASWGCAATASSRVTELGGTWPGGARSPRSYHSCALDLRRAYSSCVTSQFSPLFSE